MGKIKTSELEGVALDWAAGLACFGMPTTNAHGWLFSDYGIDGDAAQVTYLVTAGGRRQKIRPRWEPSSRWSQAGPLIERYKVGVSVGMNGKWCAVKGIPYYDHEPLVAAMRAIVGSELGDEIDMPDELSRTA